MIKKHGITVIIVILFNNYVIFSVGEEHGYILIKKYNNFYKWYSEPSTFVKAVETCMKENTVLFFPSSALEWNEVIKTLNGARGWNWIGIHDIYSEGYFITMDGTPLNNIYSNWAKGEPNNANNNENCVAIKQDKEYIDLPCHFNFTFICKTTDFSSKIDKENTFENGYILIRSLNSYYKFYRKKTTFYKAVETCMKDDAVLFTPNLVFEWKTVINAFHRGFEWNWVGIHDLFSEGNFITVDGIPLNNIYSTWSNGEPNNANNNENCVAIKQDLFYIDVPCDYLFTYICKKRIKFDNLQDEKRCEQKYDIIDAFDVPNWDPLGYIITLNSNNISIPQSILD